MAALDKESFDYWKEEHQKYLEKAFRHLSGKIGGVKEDISDLENKQKEDKVELKCEIKAVKKEAEGKISRTRQILVAGLILTAVIGAALEGHLALVDVVRAISGWIPF